MCCCKCGESNHRIHRRTDIMRHIIQKRGLRPICMLRNSKRISQILVLFYLVFLFFCHITVCNQYGTQLSILIISLRHNDHRQPFSVRHLNGKAQRLTIFQTLCHRTPVGKFPICLLKWLCNHLLYQFFPACFGKDIPFLIRLHIL